MSNMMCAACLKVGEPYTKPSCDRPDCPATAFGRKIAPFLAGDAADLTDEQIFALAKKHFGSRKGHDLIWEDDPEYAAACGMPKDARWSSGPVKAQDTLAFARALLAIASALPGSSSSDQGGSDA